MNVNEVKQKIANRFPEAHIEVKDMGNGFEITVISAAFAGLSTVKRQQSILPCLAEDITSGKIHAITIKALTPDQLSS